MSLTAASIPFHQIIDSARPDVANVSPRSRIGSEFHVSDAATHQRTWRAWIGGLVALVSSILFSFNIVLARMAYDAGSNALTVNLARSTCLTVSLYVAITLAGRSARLAPRERNASLLIGLLWAVQMIGLLLAIGFMPVGLAVLTYYIYPLILALIAAALGRDRLSVWRIVAMVVAFAGLALALDVPGGSLDWRGIAAALVASVSMATLMAWSEGTMAGQDSRVITLHVMAASMGVFIVLAVILGGLAFPSGTLGWLAFTGASVFFSIASFCLFIAIGLIGPVRTGVIDNGSPIWAILFAAVLIGEVLGPFQWIGAAIVVGAIIANQILDHHRR
jgi:drug/metabolite transporter (DMT)-like permease